MLLARIGVTRRAGRHNSWEVDCGSYMCLLRGKRRAEVSWDSRMHTAQYLQALGGAAAFQRQRSRRLLLVDGGVGLTRDQWRGLELIW